MWGGPPGLFCIMTSATFRSRTSATFLGDGSSTRREIGRKAMPLSRRSDGLYNYLERPATAKACANGGGKRQSPLRIIIEGLDENARPAGGLVATHRLTQPSHLERC